MKMLLIAEDDQTLREILEDSFEKAGWRVVAVQDGNAALEALRSHEFDLLLLDLLMPKKDGFAVLEEMKNDPAISGVPVIILSNLDSEEDIKRGLKLGAKDFFVKSHHPIGEIIEKAKTFVL